MSPVSPYDRPANFVERHLWVAIGASCVLHLGVFWFCYAVLPHFSTFDLNLKDDVIVVQLMGSLAPPAPPVKAEVNPDLQGPDVVELPKNTPPPPQPPETKPVEEVLPEKPADVIPLAPKDVKKPELEKTKTAPPKVEPPKPPVEKPKPPKKPAPSLDSQIDKDIKKLQRKNELDQVDQEIDSAVANIAARTGRGQGSSPDPNAGRTEGVRLDPEKERYYQLLRDIVSKNWVPPAEGTASNIAAIYQIRIEPNGRISRAFLKTSSGDPAFDLSVERAINKSQFPPLPDIFGGMADSPAFRFTPLEMQRRSSTQY